MVAKTKENVIEDENWVKEHQKPLALDEYDLQPNELTKEQFAEKAQVSLRNIEIWKKAGKIQAKKVRRRVDGIVRSQLIFDVADVEKFLSGANEPQILPKIERDVTEIQKTNENENHNFNSSQMFGFMNFMQNLPKILPTAAPMENAQPFLNVKDAAEFTHLSESCLRQLVADETLTKFTGKHGETMISRKQLLNL